MKSDNLLKVFEHINKAFTKYAENEEHYKIISYALAKIQAAILDNIEVPCLYAPLCVYKSIKNKFSSDIYIVAASCTLFYLFLDLMDDIEDNEIKDTIWEEIGVAEGINTANSYIFLSFSILDNFKNKARINDLRNEIWKWGSVLTLGQGKDIASGRKKNMTVDDCFKIIRQKSGASVQMYSRMGAMAATENKEIIEMYGKAGEYWGMGLQIYGDYVNIWEKTLSTDLLSQKITLPVAYGLEMATDKQRQTLMLALGHADTDLIAHTAIRQILERTGTKEYILSQIKKYKSKAIKVLNSIEKKWNLKNDILLHLISSLQSDEYSEI